MIDSCEQVIWYGIAVSIPALYGPMREHIIKNIRAASGWAIIAVFVLRGVVPIGYMPDFGAKDRSAPMIAICDGTGPEHKMMDGSEDHPPAQTSDNRAAHQHKAPCPFTVNAVFSFSGLPKAHHIPPGFILIEILALALVLVPARRFGNASSRSPPLFPY